jgi:hypothetical protein
MGITWLEEELQSKETSIAGIRKAIWDPDTGRTTPSPTLFQQPCVCLLEKRKSGERV